MSKDIDPAPAGWVLTDPTEWWSEPVSDDPWSDDESWRTEREDVSESDHDESPTHTPPTAYAVEYTTTYQLGRHTRTRTHVRITTYSPHHNA